MEKDIKSKVNDPTYDEKEIKEIEKKIIAYLSKLYKDAELLVSNNKFEDAKIKFLEFTRRVEEMYKGSKSKCYSFNNSAEFILYINTANLKQDIRFIVQNISNAYAYLGIIYYELKDFKEAYKSYKKALEWNPYNFSAKMSITKIYFKGDSEQYYSNIMSAYDMIYDEKNLAWFYRSLGYHFTEKKEWYLAKTVYLYSLQFQNNDDVYQKLENIAKLTNNISLPTKDLLKDTLVENKIPTYISKNNIRIITNFYNQIIAENQQNTPVGTEIIPLVKLYENAKNKGF